jgi:protein-tyrosine phosphatase
MIDLHCHVLPGIDDGSATLEDSLAFCRIAVEDGVGTLVCTPHMREGFYVNRAEAIRASLEGLRREVEAAGIPLELLPGCEVHIAPGLPEAIAAGEVMTYNDGGRYLLLELPYRQYPVKVEDLVFSLKLAGVTPVLAHPERIRFFQDDLGRVETLVRMGCLGQLTSSSLTGTFGARVRDLSEEMIHRGLVHLLGSDAHDTSYRPPRLAAARDRWAALAGPEAAERATESWPRAILRGEPLEPPEPRPRRAGPGRGGLLSRLLRRR